MIKIILISEISEFAYCPRRYYIQCVEKIFLENIYTIEGTIQHQSIHKEKIEKRKNFVKVNGLNVFSEKYQLKGICDLVEFNKNSAGPYVDFLEDNYDIFPVECKHGKTKKMEAYEIQLCSQVLCLEEMYNTNIPQACIYYINSKERYLVEMTSALRNKTISTIYLINEVINNNYNLILPFYKKSCPKCSMFEICNPQKESTKEIINNLWKGI